ncbi:MAG TPA: tripartite tricarboxylate transporter substrate-binding protein, partial [Xanthobacteraceae bacterium]
MDPHRRTFLRVAAGAATLPALPLGVRAQSYPSRPVHLVVGFAAGSASDILARLIGDRLSQKLGQPFIVENRGGAGGTVGAHTAARAPADGYTLLVSGSADAVT